MVGEGPHFWAGLSPQFVGLYQINFQPPEWLMAGKPEWMGYPPMHPCGDYQMELTLVIDQPYQRSSNGVQLPVFIKNGDVPCPAT